MAKKVAKKVAKKTVPKKKAAPKKKDVPKESPALKNAATKKAAKKAAPEKKTGAKKAPARREAEAVPLSSALQTPVQKRKVIRFEQGRPVLFLLDEHHVTPECIDQNADIAVELVAKANAAMIAAEGWSGGRRYDQFLDQWGEYINGEVLTNGKLDKAGKCFGEGRFVERVVSADLRVPVVGVDCEGLHEQIENDSQFGEWKGRPVGDHPLQERRTRHMLATIAEERKRLHIETSIILNVGSKHNDRIEGWIEDGTFDKIIMGNLSCIRIRAAAFSNR